jgi:hypothetical protein
VAATRSTASAVSSFPSAGHGDGSRHRSARAPWRQLRRRSGRCAGAYERHGGWCSLLWAVPLGLRTSSLRRAGSHPTGVCLPLVVRPMFRHTLNTMTRSCSPAHLRVLEPLRARSRRVASRRSVCREAGSLGAFPRRRSRCKIARRHLQASHPIRATDAHVWTDVPCARPDDGLRWIARR